MALRAARDAGIKVEKDVDRQGDQVRHASARTPTAASPTWPGRAVGGSGFARSAAGVAALYYAGVFEGDDLKRGLEVHQAVHPRQAAAAGARQPSHYFYGHYYAVQAMFLAGGDYWAEWYPAIRDQLIARQTERPLVRRVSDDYATAMALIILQMPNRYLPVYTGKGPGATGSRASLDSIGRLSACVTCILAGRTRWDCRR